MNSYARSGTSFGCLCVLVCLCVCVCIFVGIYECGCMAGVWLSLCSKGTCVIYNILHGICNSLRVWTVYTVHCVVYNVHCIVYLYIASLSTMILCQEYSENNSTTLQLYTVHCMLYIVQLHIIHCTLYTIHCTLYTVHCILYTVHCTLYTVHCTTYIIHFTSSGRER